MKANRTFRESYMSLFYSVLFKKVGDKIVAFRVNYHKIMLISMSSVVWNTTKWYYFVRRDGSDDERE